MKPKGIRDVRFPKKAEDHKEAEAQKQVAKFAPVEPEPPSTPTKPVFPKSGRVRSVVVALAIIVGLIGFYAWYQTRPPRPRTSGEGLQIGELQRHLSSYWATLKDGVAVFGGASSGFLELLGGVSDITGAPRLFLEGKGEELLIKLEELQITLRSLEERLGTMGLSEEDGLGALMHLNRGREGLDALIALLKDPEPVHFVVIFGNTSELRPGGGFIGSFADLKVERGALAAITVHDINEVDRGVDENIVPPQPLQAIARRWRSADSNWFFDYQSSAKKMREFFEMSSLYEGKKIEGVVAITPVVVRDLLEATGPIELVDGTKITADNFLTEIQTDVQAGLAEGDSNPKRILADLAIPLKEKVMQMPEAKMAELFIRAGSWIKEKDLMIYFEDEALQKVAGAYDADGSLYPLPADFRGDYLAAVTANIGGGKTDLVMRGRAVLQSRITNDGRVENRLTVSRTHGAEKDHAWWYRVPNESQLRIFTARGAVVLSAEGGFRKNIVPKADYRSGFRRDPDVQRIEGSAAFVDNEPQITEFQESGRQGFSTWMRTEPENTSVFSIDYFRKLSRPLSAGDVYTFVFESQSGADMAFEAKIAAPDGYKWQESGTGEYAYTAEDPPGRLLIDLTLQKA